MTNIRMSSGLFTHGEVFSVIINQGYCVCCPPGSLGSRQSVCVFRRLVPRTVQTRAEVLLQPQVRRPLGLLNVACVGVKNNVTGTTADRKNVKWVLLMLL